ncbi:hypothetical protein ACMAY6_15180 [Luminiphilus sp. nBUS_16]|uniref:hypothetical protein n=1 Tax=Luminiphilus sp. nBUS_16 TaxID=3395315 RepID=UPI003EBA7BFB
MLRVMTACLICLLPMWAFTQSDVFKGLAEEMTSAEREASGVEELSGPQQEFLNNWLRDRFMPAGSNTATPAVDGQGMGAGTLSDIEQEKAIEAEVERRVTRELAAAEEQGVQMNESVGEPFEASITGVFTGWNGGTVFALDNGDVWRQRNDKVYHHRDADRRVRFKRGLLGLWRMTVVSTGASVAVAPVFAGR